MIWNGRAVRVFAHAAPTDLRKGYDGLSAIVRESLGRDPTSGDLYLFVARNRIRAKVLLWDGTGLCVFAKRLEHGRFAALWERGDSIQMELTSAELELFLEGCVLVGQQRLSPPEIDSKALLRNVSYDSLRPCSTSPESRISRF